MYEQIVNSRVFADTARCTDRPPLARLHVPSSSSPCRRISQPSLTWRAPDAVLRHKPVMCVITRSAQGSSLTNSSSNRVEQDVEEYWRGVLEGVDKPTARKLLEYVDPAYLLGLPPYDAGPATAGSASGGKGKRKTPPVLYYHEATKKQHPTKVLLVRVGEFFEATGIDAVLLVQHAGLNPMGAGNPPRAGCPRANLRRTVADLVHAGLSVVVCEEAGEGYGYGYKRTNTKTRYVAQVLTPATPHLLYGLIDEDADLALESTPPLLGISMQVGGFTVIEVNVELFKVTVTQGLTEDAVYARLYEGGLSPPLFIHIPGGMGGQEAATVAAPWERRVAHAFRSQAGSVERYTGADPVCALVARVRQMLDLPPNAHFTTVSSSATDQPRPLYHSTAANLGLHSSRGVPALLDSLLPPTTPSASRAWLRQLLLFPPPPRVGGAVLRACRELRDMESPVPTFPAIGVTNVVLKLSQREANDIFFRELAALCQSVNEACTTPDLAPLSDALLEAAAHATGMAFSREDLAQACSMVQEAIKGVVEQQERMVGGGSSDEGSQQQEEAAGAAGDTAFDALARFRQTNENKFRGRVQNSCIQQEHDEVEGTWQEVEAAVRNLMGQVAEALRQGNNGTSIAKPGAKSAPAVQLVYNTVNNAVWLKAKGPSAKMVQQLGLQHPKDRLGCAETGFYSMQSVEQTQDRYRRACAQAAEAVKRQLQDLAERLQLYPPDYVPGMALEGPGAEGLDVRGMWPYWLDGRARDVVRNDCSMQGLFLLTGPNMAGKSTLLRTLCAVSLLSACGLAVPAQVAAVPYLDAFMLRNFSQDSPIDGRSSFAVEMTEMKYVLSDVSRSSLVLVDELGKGTEVRAGAALAGAMLEALAEVGCKGIFATHLHVLLDMELQLPGVELMCMEVRRREGAGAADTLMGAGLKPTWRMVPGCSRESLALEVARDCDVPEDVVLRAAELYTGMHAVSYARVGAQEEQEGGSSTAESKVLSLTGSSGAAARVAALSQPDSPSAVKVPTRAIEEAGEVLLAATAHTLESLMQQQRQQPAQHLAAIAAGQAEGPAPAELDGGMEAAAAAVAGEIPRLQFVRPGQDPPPRTVGCACIYVVLREDGRFYVGSTDSLKQRIDAHRRRKPSSSSRVGGGAGIQVVYVALHGGAGGASTAKVVEAAVIQALEQDGFPLLSTTDARRKHKPKFS